MAAASQTSEHHITPFKVLFSVFISLIVLTILTVVFHELKMGWLAAPVAFVIATSKAMLVISYFMGLKYDTVLNRVIFGAGFFFLALLFIFCALDIWTRVAVTSTL